MKAVKTLAAVLATLALTGCVKKAEEAPALTGPSGASTSIGLTASPDSISHDGGSQSRITVTVFGPDGKPFQRPPSLRLDMFVNGIQQDYGTLSARTIVPNGVGEAVATYTAPAPPPGNLFGTCNGLAGTCIQIVASAIGTSFDTVAPQSVVLRLVPPGVILPPAGTPTAAFRFSPQPATANLPVIFDASLSTPGSGASQIVTYNWSFGDGTTGTGSPVTHTYSAQSAYNVTLTVTNDRGLTASTTQTVSVGSAALPTPSFTVSPAAPGVGEQVFFNASASQPGAGGAITSYRWTFGDGGTGSGSTITHTYAAVGAYTVQLTVSDEAGLSATSPGTVVTVAVPGSTPPTAPTARFTFSPAAPASGQSIFFNGSSSTAGTGHTLTSYSWAWGDGTAAGTGVAPTHAYAANGSYTVTLTVTDEIGQVGITSAAVAVAASGGSGGTAPTASFTFGPPNPTVGELVTFNASTSTAGTGHSIVSYLWTFGDGGPTGSGVSVTHAYTAAATYSVTVRVTDEIGQSTTSAPTGVVVGAPQSPTANFTFSPTSPGRNDQVVFDASSSVQAGAGQPIVDVAWNFGDGTAVIHCAAAGPVPPATIADCPGPTIRISAHTFTINQTFVVNLVVTDSAGRTGSRNQNVTVALAQPTVSFSSSPSSPVAGNSVNFNASATTFFPGSQAAAANAFSWTFGDGTPTVLTSGPNTSHTYLAAGTYTAALSVTDNKGRTGTASITITVLSANPTASFTASIFDAATHTMLFDGSGSTAVSPATIASYAWAFGDGGFGVGSTPTHSYAVAGTYPVRLTVTDTLGRTGSVTTSVTVP
jgi:PKD repeat protein